MTTPSTRDVHTNKLLSNVSTAYRNEEYIGDRILPRIVVNNQTDQIAKYNKGDWFRDNAAIWTPGTKKPVGDYRLATASTYTCEPWSMGKLVTDATVRNADDPYRPAREAVEWATDQVLLSQERRVAGLLFDASVTYVNYTVACASLTGGGGVAWDTYETSTPLADIEVVCNKVRTQIGRRPNTMILGAQVWSELKNHPDLLDRAKYTQLGVVNIPLLRSLTDGLDNIYVGNAVYAASQEGASTEDTLSNIWGTYVLICWVPPRPSLLVPATGYIIQWGGRQVQEYRYDEEEATKYSVTEWADELSICPEAGYLLSSVVS